jgi:hypothetical protein
MLFKVHSLELLYACRPQDYRSPIKRNLELINILTKFF